MTEKSAHIDVSKQASLPLLLKIGRIIKTESIETNDIFNVISQASGNDSIRKILYYGIEKCFNKLSKTNPLIHDIHSLLTTTFETENTKTQENSSINTDSGCSNNKKGDIVFQIESLHFTIFKFLDIRSLCTCSQVNFEWLVKSVNPKAIFYFNTTDCFKQDSRSRYVIPISNETLRMDNILRFKNCEKLRMSTWDEQDQKLNDFFDYLSYFNKVKHLILCQRYDGSLPHYYDHWTDYFDTILSKLMKINGNNIKVIEIDRSLMKCIYFWKILKQGMEKLNKLKVINIGIDPVHSHEERFDEYNVRSARETRHLFGKELRYDTPLQQDEICEIVNEIIPCIASKIASIESFSYINNDTDNYNDIFKAKLLSSISQNDNVIALKHLHFNVCKSEFNTLGLMYSFNKSNGLESVKIRFDENDKDFTNEREILNISRILIHKKFKDSPNVIVDDNNDDDDVNTSIDHDEENDVTNENSIIGTTESIVTKRLTFDTVDGSEVHHAYSHTFSKILKQLNDNKVDLNRLRHLDLGELIYEDNLEHIILLFEEMDAMYKNYNQINVNLQVTNYIRFQSHKQKHEYKISYKQFCRICEIFEHLWTNILEIDFKFACHRLNFNYLCRFFDSEEYHSDDSNEEKPNDDGIEEMIKQTLKKYQIKRQNQETKSEFDKIVIIWPENQIARICTTTAHSKHKLSDT